MTIMISRAFGYHFNNSASGAATAILSRGIDTLAANGTFAAERKAIREETAIYIARAMDYSLRLNPVVSFNSERYVKDSSLNVRKGPSTAYAVLGTVNTNEKVQIGYQVGDWTLVKTSKNIIGFVSTYYLSVNELSASDDNLNKKNHPLASQTLVIDPGHGGTDAGAIGFGLKEKDVTLDTALRLKKLLAQTPLNVKYTREKDVTLNLVKDRVPYALSVKGDMFVSIHANAGGGTGSETYYYGKTATNPYVADSKLLAQYIQKRLIVAMETKNRGFKHGNFHVIRENRMPAVLVELAFIDTKTDNTKLKSPVYREKAAKAIYLGILDYYKAKGFNVAEYYKAI